MSKTGVVCQCGWDDSRRFERSVAGMVTIVYVCPRCSRMFKQTKEDDSVTIK